MSSTKVITGRVRGSYVNVFRPRYNDLSGQDEYSMSVLIPKTDTVTVARLNAAAEEARVKKFANKTPANFRHPLRDGDTEREGDPAYAGHWFINVKSKNPPGIVDAQRQEVIDPQAFLSGDYCRVAVNAYAYDKKGNRGVSFGLNNVQVLDKGEPLTNQTRAEDDFDEWGDSDAAGDFG